jgi:molybdenum cofactor synthesis domain-containing protein
MRADHAPVAGPSTALVITVSTRAARGEYADRTGPVLVAALRGMGFDTPDALIVPDLAETGETSLADALRRGIEAEAAVILTTGGTGLTEDDVTAEVTAEVCGSLDGRQVPGIAEALRAAGIAGGVPTAMLSRGLTVVVHRTLVVNLPGSQGAVADGIRVLTPVLPHAVADIRRPRRTSGKGVADMRRSSRTSGEGVADMHRSSRTSGEGA